MSKQLLVLLLIALFAATIVMAKKGAKEEEEEVENPNSDVVTLNTKSIDEFIAKNEYALIEFYAPVCSILWSNIHIVVPSLQGSCSVRSIYNVLTC